MITGIIVALPEELNTLTKKKIAPGKRALLTKNIMIAHAGAGPSNAEKATQELIKSGCSKLISWGCAAGLADSLKAGDLCLPKQLISNKLQQLPIHAEWQQHTETILSNLHPFYSGPLCESSSIVSKNTQKKQLHQATGSIALDMESAAIARIAKQTGIPYLVIRVIADPSDMNLPSVISLSMSNEGVINKKQLAINIIKKPFDIPGLIKLGIHFQTAQKKLKFVATMIKEISEFPATQIVSSL